MEQPGVVGPLPGSCCWKAHLRGWWGRPAAEEPRRRKRRRMRRRRKVALMVLGGAGVEAAPCLGVAGISGNFVGRIKGAKCPFDLQFLTWDFS